MIPESKKREFNLNTKVTVGDGYWVRGGGLGFRRNFKIPLNSFGK